MSVTVAVRVGAALGLEGRLDGVHRQPQRPDHVVQHVIVLVAQAPAVDLHRDVAVAQVVGGPGQGQRIADLTADSDSGAARTSTIAPSSVRSRSPCFSTVPRGSTSAPSSPPSSRTRCRLLRR